MPKKKDRAAAALGRKGGKALARKMTPEQRSEAARRAVNARWAAYREEQAKRKSKP